MRLHHSSRIECRPILWGWHEREHLPMRPTQPDQPQENATLWRLPSTSTDFEEGPVLRVQRDSLILSSDFEKSSGEYAREHLSFYGRLEAPGVLHLRIYLDDVGCLEVAATDFTPPPERRK